MVCSRLHAVTDDVAHRLNACLDDYDSHGLIPLLECDQVETKICFVGVAPANMELALDFVFPPFAERPPKGCTAHSCADAGADADAALFTVGTDRLVVLQRSSEPWSTCYGRDIGRSSTNRTSTCTGRIASILEFPQDLMVTACACNINGFCSSTPSRRGVSSQRSDTHSLCCFAMFLRAQLYLATSTNDPAKALFWTW